MRNPFLLFTAILIASIASVARAQPLSPAGPVQSRTLSAAGGGAPASTKEPSFDGTTWWNYVKILAADNMEGRETGSPGLRKAQEFVVEQLKRAGLEPLGSASYYQPVRFESRQIVEKESSLALVHNGEVEPLTLGEDAIFSTRVDLAHSVDAPLVFSETYYRSRAARTRDALAPRAWRSLRGQLFPVAANLRLTLPRPWITFLREPGRAPKSTLRYEPQSANLFLGGVV